MKRSVKNTLSLMMLACLLLPVPAQSKPVQVTRIQKGSTHRTIASRRVDLTPAEKSIGIVNIRSVLPIFQNINQKKHIFSPQAFQKYVSNFHYPYRKRFFLKNQAPPTHVVLHWTANKHTQIPLYTLSAFLRSFQRGRLRERKNKYKNVSNYFLTGDLTLNNGHKEAYLVKLTRGDVQNWGDIPRVTAYPTDDLWDDNKYDGRGALGVEIESPNFRSFYYNYHQKQKIHNLILMVLRERGQIENFKDLKYSRHWEQMIALHNYLKTHLADIDVNSKGRIPQKYQKMDRIMADFQYGSGLYSHIKKIYGFVSGHGIVAREYNERMHLSGRHRDASYHKIDFTEPQVFVVAMDILRSDMQYKGVDGYIGYDLATQNFIRSQLKNGTVLSKADKGRLADMQR